MIHAKGKIKKEVKRVSLLNVGLEWNIPSADTIRLTG
jgi:hypothetical protein